MLLLGFALVLAVRAVAERYLRRSKRREQQSSHPRGL
jgi:hypothetical protein